jgi:hypothetical protein
MGGSIMLYFKIVTSILVPAAFSALTFGPFIFIKPEKVNDVCMLNSFGEIRFLE